MDRRVRAGADRAAAQQPDLAQEVTEKTEEIEVLSVSSVLSCKK
jgi:hypothetical protein